MLFGAAALLLTFGAGLFLGGRSAETLREELAQVRAENELNSHRQVHVGQQSSIAHGSSNRTTVSTSRDKIARRPQETREDRVGSINQHVLSNLVAQTYLEESKAYATLLSGLGASPQDAELLSTRRLTIHAKAIAAGEAVAEVQRERLAYDAQARSTLGEERYEEYRRFEGLKPAAREAGLVSDYARAQGVEIPPEVLSTLIPLIARAGATTTETAHGPYDPPVVSAIGKEAVLDHLQETVTRLQESIEPLNEAIVGSSIPERYRLVTQQYFAQRLEKFMEIAARVERPPASARAPDRAPSP